MPHIKTYFTLLYRQKLHIFAKMMKNKVRQRYELKYGIRTDQIQPFLEFLNPFLNTDPHIKQKNLKYPVTSLYFDTPGQLFYSEKISGEYYRRKLRIRQYQPHFDDTEPFFLEIKEKVGEFVVKKRAILPYNDLVTLWTGDFTEEKWGFLSSAQKKVIESTKFLLHTLKLVPQLLISYDRRAFFGKQQPDFRLTIDTDLRYKTVDTFPLKEFIPQDMRQIAPASAIIEFKSSSHFPRWLAPAVQHFDLQSTSISKYCINLDDARQYQPVGL